MTGPRRRSRTRSWPAARARASSPGASRSPSSAVRRSATRRTGAGPIPGFGDPRRAIVVLGLAPAAHGANRTGRVFTGDRSGDFLFALDAPRRPRQPADLDARRRRARARRRVGDGGGEVRAAGERPDTGRARRVRAVPARASWRRSTRSSSCASARSASPRPAVTTACGRARASATASRWRSPAGRSWCARSTRASRTRSPAASTAGRCSTPCLHRGRRARSPRSRIGVVS